MVTRRPTRSPSPRAAGTRSAKRQEGESRMPKEQPPGASPFDLDKLKELIEMMESHGLTEISLRRGDEQWRLRRGGHAAAAPVFAAHPAPQPAAHVSVPPTTAAPSQPTPAAAPSQAEGVVIKSPIVGTFYSSPTPDDPPFVTVGKRIEPDTIVCIVEAMKVFNQIPAEVSGTVTEILAASGDAVDYGQPLFRVKP